MGQKIVLVDDFDGETEGAVTLPFFVDGQEYEVDLGPENLEKYTDLIEQHRQMLLELADAGRPVRRQTPLSAPRGRTPKQLAEIRTWLRANGHEVKDQGRIPEKLLDLYETRNRLAEIKAGESTEVNGDSISE